MLSRTRADAEVSFEKANPCRKRKSKDSLVKALGKDEKLIVIRGIYTAYGLKKAKIISYAYENEDSLKRIEIAKKKARKKSLRKQKRKLSRKLKNQKRKRSLKKKKSLKLKKKKRKLKNKSRKKKSRQKINNIIK